MRFPNLSDMDFFKNAANTFSLERNHQLIRNDIKGFFCKDGAYSAIQVLDNYGIQEGDWLIESSTHKRCFVDELYPLGSEVNDVMIRYKSEHQMQEMQNTSGFHIENIYGNAIIGNQSNAVINSGISFDQIRTYLSEQNIPSPDQKKLQELVSAVESVVKNGTPAQKGIFSKFLDISEKYSGLISIIMQPLISNFFK